MSQGMCSLHKNHSGFPFTPFSKGGETYLSPHKNQKKYYNGFSGSTILISNPLEIYQIVVVLFKN